MKSYLLMTSVLFIIMLFFPLVTIISDNNSTADYETTAVSAATTEKNASETVKVKAASTGKVTEMTAEEYVYGAVCAEMPATFHPEALKAQAVASYTYMKWIKENADNPSPLSGVISDNPAIHQAFTTEEELKDKWGSSYSIYSAKVREAVDSVLYEYLTYNNETAMTVFHGLSPGKTASSSEIWKTDVPYLQSVTAPGDKLSPDITSEVTLSIKEFIEPFNGAKEDDFDEIFKSIKKSDSDFVTEISYKSTVLNANDLRSAYELKSPFFTMKKSENSITLNVHGKGHGVGMSQYSADYMARQGSSYKEILAHFYKGTELKRS